MQSDPIELCQIAQKGSFHHRQLEWAYICLIKKYRKFGNIEYQKKKHSQTLLSCLPHLPISVDYQILTSLKIDWTCEILKLSSILPTYFFTIYDWYVHWRVLSIFAFFFLVIKATVRPESLLSLNYWRFATLFGDSLWPSDSISLYFLLFPMALGCKFKMFGRCILLIQIFSISNNKNSIKFVKLR